MRPSTGASLGKRGSAETRSLVASSRFVAKRRKRGSRTWRERKVGEEEGEERDVEVGANSMKGDRGDRHRGRRISRIGGSRLEREAREGER